MCICSKCALSDKKQLIQAIIVLQFFHSTVSASTCRSCRTCTTDTSSNPNALSNIHCINFNNIPLRQTLPHLPLHWLTAIGTSA